MRDRESETHARIQPNNVIIYASIDLDSVWIGLKGNTQIHTHHSFPIDEHFVFQSSKRNGKQFDSLCLKFAVAKFRILPFFWTKYCTITLHISLFLESVIGTFFFVLFVHICVLLFFCEYWCVCNPEACNLKIILIYVQISFIVWKIISQLEILGNTVSSTIHI